MRDDSTTTVRLGRGVGEDKKAGSHPSGRTPDSIRTTGDTGTSEGHEVAEVYGPYTLSDTRWVLYGPTL